MATVIQGGQGPDLGQSLRQTAAVFQQQQQLNDTRRQNQQQAALYASSQMMNIIKQIPDYQNDASGFWAKNPQILGQLTNLLSAASGRQLTGKESVDLAGQLSSYAAANPTTNELTYRSLNSILAGLSPTELTQYQQTGQLPTRVAGSQNTGASGGAPAQTPVAANPNAGKLRIPANTSPIQFFGALAGLGSDAQAASALAAGHLGTGEALMPAAQDRYVTPNYGLLQAVSRYKSVGNQPGFDLGSLAAQYQLGAVPSAEDQSGQATSALDLAQKALADPNTSASDKAALQKLVSILNPAPAKATGSPASNEGKMSAEALAKHEAQTGDYHYPAMVGIKEGIVNENAMQHGGQQVVKALNDKYPVYADGKSGTTPTADTSDALLQLLQQQQLLADIRGGPGGQQVAPAFQVPNPVAIGQVSSPDQTSQVQQYPDTLGLAQETPQQTAQNQAYLNQQAALKNQQMASEAAKKTRTAQAAALMASTQFGALKAAHWVADMPKNFGAAIEEMTMGAGGKASTKYRDQVLANRDAMYIGKYTKEAYNALPLEQRSQIAHTMDQVIQSFSPEFIASAGGEKSADMSARRSETEARKVALLQAQVASLKDSSAYLKEMLTPITTAMGSLNDLTKTSWDMAKAEKKTLAQFWNEDGKGLHDQINSYAGLIDTFAHSLGVDLSLRTELQQGSDNFWQRLIRGENLFVASPGIVGAGQGTYSTGIPGGTLSAAETATANDIVANPPKVGQ